MKNEIRVGDRVRVYDASNSKKIECVVSALVNDGVIINDGGFYYLGQVKKLKAKKAAPLNGSKFVPIPAGTFQMGSPKSETGRFSDETQHPVTITQPFEMQTTQVTQSEWEKVMGNNPSRFKGSSRPVERVSWDDVQKFISKLNESQSEYVYRLPTEAEWEYACRAGTTSAYFFGDDAKDIQQYAWTSVNSDDQTHDVGTLKPNPWRLYDMCGNVWEWVHDWHAPYEVAE